AAGWEWYQEVSEGRVMLWKVDPHSQPPFVLAKSHRTEAPCEGVSPDLKRFATVTLPEGGESPGEVKLWDMATGRVLAAIPFPEEEDSPALSFGPGGKMLAIACGRGATTELYDLGTMPPRHVGSVPEALFTPDGRLVAVRNETGADLLELPTLQK